MFSRKNGIFKQNVIRKRITFYGQVQAVGFRYRSLHAAELYGTTGWVRNDPYGTVTMEIQGTEQQIRLVIQSLENDSYIEIYNTESREIPLVEDERRFRVAY